MSDIQNSVDEEAKLVAKAARDLLYSIISEYIKKHKKKAVIILIGVILAVLVLSDIMSFVSVFYSSDSTSRLSCYASEPKEIDAADADFMQREIELQNTISNVERDHSGYDEYRYNIGDIGHDPYTLTNYLSAKNGAFTYADIESQVEDVFNEMYTLSFRHVREKRTRIETRTKTVTTTVTKTGTRQHWYYDNTLKKWTYYDEEYEYEEEESEEVEYEVEVEYYVDILETTLSTKPLNDIVNEYLSGEERIFYEAYQSTHGGLQQFESPVKLYWYNYVSGYFGARKNPVTGADEIHNGIDIELPAGTKIYSGMDGTVTEAGTDAYYGKYVILSDYKGTEIMYGHLTDLSVSRGDCIVKGKKIGTSGHCVPSLTPHLHLELKFNGEYYNPLYYFDAEQATLYGEGPQDVGGGITPPSSYSDETARKLLEEAAKYVGYPYVWGGSNPRTSFDCSGFVCWVFTNSGVKNLSRTTAQGIYNQCTPVSSADAKPGDLVFFTRTYNSGTPVTHVGIYCGDNIFIHCGDPIKYSSLSSSYWVNHWYGFGRLN